MLVLGLPSIIAGALCFLIPETKDKELPQNMKDTANNDDINIELELDDVKETPIIKIKNSK